MLAIQSCPIYAFFVKVPLGGGLLRPFILAFVALHFVCLSTIGQTVAGTNPAPSVSVPPQPQATPSPPDVNAIILQYQAALRAESEAHRTYLEKSLDQVKWLAGIIAVLGSVIFTWLNLNSRSAIRAQVNARFRANFDSEVAARLARYDKTFDDNKEKLEQNAEKTKALGEEQLRLTDRFAELASDLTFAFHVLSEKSAAPEWDAAREEAKKRLEAQRCDFPYLRGLGMLLGRLHKRSLDYEKGVEVLTQVMKERDKKEMPRNVDYAALLFNRACYENLAAEILEKTDPRRGQSLRTAAWNDLNMSVQIDSDNRPQAVGNPDSGKDGDSDLQSLWNETDRKKEDLGKHSNAVPDGNATQATGTRKLLRSLFGGSGC